MIANDAPPWQLTSIEVRAPLIAPPVLVPLMVIVPLPGVLSPQDTEPEMAVTVPMVPFF